MWWLKNDANVLNSHTPPNVYTFIPVVFVLGCWQSTYIPSYSVNPRFIINHHVWIIFVKNVGNLQNK